MTDQLEEGPAETDDHDLLRRVADGDPVALGLLYDRFAQTILNLGHRVLGSTAQAEDVLQETFIRVWKAAGTYDRWQGRVDTWLFSIARNRAIDRLRSERARTRRDRSAGLKRQEAGAAPPPSNGVVKNEQRERVQAAISTLSEAQREAVELAYFEGLTQREIASRTDTALGTVKTRIRLGLQKLRNALGGKT